MLATGDFSANRDMMYRYAPSYAPYIADEVYDSEPNYERGLPVRRLVQGAMASAWACGFGAGWQKIFPTA